MVFTRSDVEAIAGLANLDLDDTEIDVFARQLGDILEYANQVQQIDTTGVSPTSHALDLVNVFGEDIPREPWPREQLLELAPERTADGFLVPPIGA